ncbi:hypothetical protein JCM8097_007502 [Rhodosporidiobolus ruineniae]
MQIGNQVAYSEGSKIEGFTGTGLALRLRGEYGSAVLWAKKPVSMGHLQGVYPSELVSLNLAITSILAFFYPSSISCSFTHFADNASADDAPASPRARPAQLVRLNTLRRLHSLQTTHANIAIHSVWVPAHTGIEGNEEADVLAKLGAEWGREEEERLNARKAQALAARRTVEMPRHVMDMDKSLTSIEDASKWWADKKSYEAARRRGGWSQDIGPGAGGRGGGGGGGDSEAAKQHLSGQASRSID